MDCFYAAVEERDRPQLRGEPIAVGGSSQSRRGVLTTCNYEARKFGVRSAMPTFQALQRCPHLIVLPVRFEAYRHESRRIRNILRQYTDHIEPLSLDEAYLDVSEIRRPAAEVATEIRQRIRQTTGLTASAGIAPNKMLAKIASDWRKPNGQYEITPVAVAAFMKPLSVTKIWGVGKRAAERLQEMGIETCGQLQEVDRVELHTRFGKFGGELYELCRGLDTSPVVSNRIRKSLSVERTFSSNRLTLADCQQSAADIFDELTADLARHGGSRPVAKVFAKLKYADFSRASIERSGLDVSLAAYQDLLAEAFERRAEPVRLIGLGVRFADPERSAARQLEFDLG